MSLTACFSTVTRRWITNYKWQNTCSWSCEVIRSKKTWRRQERNNACQREERDTETRRHGHSSSTLRTHEPDPISLNPNPNPNPIPNPNLGKYFETPVPYHELSWHKIVLLLCLQLCRGSHHSALTLVSRVKSHQMILFGRIFVWVLLIQVCILHIESMTGALGMSVHKTAAIIGLEMASGDCIEQFIHRRSSESLNHLSTTFYSSSPILPLQICGWWRWCMG